MSLGRRVGGSFVLSLIGFSDSFGETLQKSRENRVAKVDLAEVQILGDLGEVRGDEAQWVGCVRGFNCAALGGINDFGDLGGVEVALAFICEAVGVEVPFDLEDFGIGPRNPTLALGSALAQGDCGVEFCKFGFCFALGAQALDFGVLTDPGLEVGGASDGLGGLELSLAFGVALPHGVVLLGNDLISFKAAALALQADAVAVGSLHVQEKFAGHDRNCLDLHGGDVEAESVSHISEFSSHALDDRPAFAQGIVQAEVRKLAADRRLDYLSKVRGDHVEGEAGIGKVNGLDRLFWSSDRVDSKPHNFHALVLGCDLVGLEGDGLQG